MLRAHARMDPGGGESGAMTTSPARASRDPRIATLAVPGGDLEARFATGVGMVGCSLTHRGEELLGVLGGLEAYSARGKTFGIPFLYPWANRLGAWEYTVADHTVTIDPDGGVVRPDDHGLPIHGLLPWHGDWVVTDTGTGDDAAWLRAELDWAAHRHLLAIFPFAHRVELAIALDADTLRITTTVQATGDDPVPLSFGFHPYLAPPGAPRAAWEVELPALTHLTLDDMALPDGGRTPQDAERFTLGTRTFDDLYAVEAETASFAVADGVRRVEVDFEAGFTHAQVFAPAANDVICFEPMTAPVDALRSHDGLRLVAPGATLTTAFAVRVLAL
jgi:aldose 1-epimerase